MPSNFSETDLRLGCLVVSGELQSPLPLEHTMVAVQIQGPLASVVVSQRFGNPLSKTVELEYLFPLPKEAALTDFLLKIGARTIRADLQELSQARQSYEEARVSGSRAGLLEQRRPNLFAVSLANIQPGETILAELRYQERVRFSENGYEFVFPMGITPKYDSPAHPEEGQGVQVPLARPGEMVGTLELSLAVDAGLACDEPTSPSHPLEVLRLDERRFSVRLAGDQIHDRDFVLRYTVAGAAPAAAAWASPASEASAGSNYFLATVLPPRIESEPLQIQREFIFVLDRSGSMGGEPILQARNALRACLRALNPGDSFRVLLFDNELEWYRAEFSPVTQAEVEQADAFLAGVAARGGTEIIAALEAALELPADPQRTRFIVFLTDGAVSAEARALETLRRKLGAARVFTFGIGPSVNRALLARMAALGRGESEFLQAGEDIEGAVIRFQDRVSFPVLTDLQLNWQGGSAWDVYPARLPDLYIGQPLQVCGLLKANGPIPMVLEVLGRCGEKPFRTALTVALSSQPDPAMARVWAKARIEDMMEESELVPQKSEKLRSTIIGLALEHRLVTPFTAFVAIDQQEGTPGQKPVLIRVSQPLPAGLNFAAFAPQARMVQASATLYQAPPMPSPASPKKLRAMSVQDEAPDFVSLGYSSDVQFLKKQAPVPPSAAPGSRLPFPPAREDALRWLARTQQLNGSWGEDVERTAAALLAFLRAGHTTRSGSFRQAVNRAVMWLAGQTGSGFAAQARAKALQELADATGAPSHSLLAAEAAQAVPSPLPAVQPGELGELRRAALTGDKPARPLDPPDSEPGLTWYILTL